MSDWMDLFVIFIPFALASALPGSLSGYLSNVYVHALTHYWQVMWPS